MKRVIMLLTLLVSFNVFAADQKGTGVFFDNLKDGATFKCPIVAKFSVKGMKVKSAGTIEDKTGHHHLFIDAEGIPENEVIPTDATHMHFGKGQTECDLRLAPGKHTLTLQFANGAHLSYGPKFSKTINITVEK